MKLGIRHESSTLIKPLTTTRYQQHLTFNEKRFFLLKQTASFYIPFYCVKIRKVQNISPKISTDFKYPNGKIDLSFPLCTGPFLLSHPTAAIKYALGFLSSRPANRDAARCFQVHSCPRLSLFF